MLRLADLKEFTEEEVREHIASTFQAPTALDGYEVLVAYESVGDWGCDSSSFTLLRRINDGVLFENHGSHCSCYGFENQWEPEETTVESLRSRTWGFAYGGYDDDRQANEAAIREYVEGLAS